MSIHLTKHWDTPLTYDVLKNDDLGAEAGIFVGRRELLGALQNAIEQPDRRGTYLVSGYRGAGKTTLVIEAARLARRSLESQGLTLLPVVLNVSEVSASLSNASDPVAPPLQIDARRLLTALLRALRNNLRDLPDPTRDRVAEKTVDRTYRTAVLRNLVASRPANGAAPSAATAPADRSWSRNDLLSKIEAAYRIASATQYVERSTQGSENNLRRMTESSVGVSVANALKLVPPIAAIVAVGLGIGALTSVIGGVLAGLAALVVVSFAYTRKTTREASATETAAVELVIDYSIHQLENDLKDILTHLQDRGLRTIVILEELDKVDDAAGKQLDAVIRYFKNLFTQAPALFFFLTDKQYYDVVAKKIDEARRKRTYSVEHTFFTHRVFVNRPTVRECFEYLRCVACDESEKESIGAIMQTDGDRVRDLTSMELRERFLRVLLFRAQDHIFDLKNEMRRYVQVSNGVSSLVCDEDSLPASEQALASFQFLVEQKARAHAFRGGGEYANEVLRNCLFSVFADSEPGDSARMERFYPMDRATGDQVTANEDARIRTAVESLVRDLQRGGVVDVDQASKSVKWIDTAARFAPKAELEQHEKELTEKLEAHASSLAFLADGGVLHRVLPGEGGAAQALVVRLREEAAKPESSRTPLTVDQTTSTASALDGEVARVLGAAFDAHRDRLLTRFGWTASPIETGAAVNAWRVAGGTPPGTVDAGDVVLVYGAPDLVPQGLTAFLNSTLPTRRLAVVSVVAADGSPWQTQRESILQKWRAQLGADLLERTLLTVVPLHEELGAHEAEARWADATADELIVAHLWVNQSGGSAAPPEPLPPPVAEIVSTAEGETTSPSFEAAFRAWLDGSGAAVCWLSPPGSGVLEQLFAGMPQSDGGAIACASAAAIAAPSETAGRAAYARLARSGRLVVGLDPVTLAGLPQDFALPRGARAAVAWSGPVDGRLARAVSASDVSALRPGEESVPVELADLVGVWNAEHALRLLEAAAGTSAAATRRLAGHYAMRKDAAASRRWREQLVSTGDWGEIELLAEELADVDPPTAQNLYEEAAANGSDSATVWLAAELHEREPDAAKKWRERLLASGDPGSIERLARRLRDRDADMARSLHVAAGERGSWDAVRQLVLDLLPEAPADAEVWQRRLLDTGSAQWITPTVAKTVRDDPARAATWASLAEASGKSGAIASVADALEELDPTLATRLRKQLPQPS